MWNATYGVYSAFEWKSLLLLSACNSVRTDRLKISSLWMSARKKKRDILAAGILIYAPTLDDSLAKWNWKSFVTQLWLHGLAIWSCSSKYCIWVCVLIERQKGLLQTQESNAVSPFQQRHRPKEWSYIASCELHLHLSHRSQLFLYPVQTWFNCPRQHYSSIFDAWRVVNFTEEYPKSR